MVAVKSTRYPSLRVSDVNVKFVDGVAEVTDAKALDRLRQLSDMGVEVPDEAPKRKPGRPKKSE